jgi:uncharacterized protein
MRTNTTRPTVAIVGASSDRNKYGNKAVRAYLRRGWDVYPVNPRGGPIEGLDAFTKLADIPVAIQRVSLYLPPAIGVALLPDIAALKPQEVLINPGAESPELLARARELRLPVQVACSIVAIGESPADYSE